MSVISGIWDVVDQLIARIHKLEMRSYPEWVYLTTPLSSASWDGDTYSTTAKTLIDLSAVFGVPAGVKAILAIISIRDVDSQSVDDNFLVLSPNSTAGSGPIVRSMGRYDNNYESQSLIVPCDANGDIYYQIAATGVNSMTVYIQIWGYMV